MDFRRTLVERRFPLSPSGWIDVGGGDTKDKWVGEFD